jgi:hypothetical protein
MTSKLGLSVIESLGNSMNDNMVSVFDIGPQVVSGFANGNRVEKAEPFVT